MDNQLGNQLDDQLDRQSFPRIWILIILIILIGGGVLVRQYLMAPEGTKTTGEKGLEEVIVENFIEDRIKTDTALYTVLPEDVQTADTTYATVLTSFSEIILTTPRLKSYEIIESKEIEPSKVQVSAKAYLINSEGEKIGYYDEVFTVDKNSNTPIVFMEQSAFKPLAEQDECKDLPNTVLLERDKCYWRTAMERGDIEFCERIEDPHGATNNENICYRELAILKNDFSLCEQHPLTIDSCAFRFAVNNKDEEFCEKTTNYKNLCLYRVAILKNDTSLCEKCEEDYQLVCENYFQETKAEAFGKEMIRILQPKPNEEITSSVEIKGWGAANRGEICIRIKDKNGYELGLDCTEIESKFHPRFHSPFSFILPYNQPSSEKGIMEIFAPYNKRGGAIDNIVVIPVSFSETPTSLSPAPELSEWKVYKNEKDGYEIEYPRNWSHSTGGIIQDFCSSTPVKGVELECPPAYRGVSLRNDALDITAPNFCLNSHSISCGEGVTSKEIIVDDRKGKLFEIKIGNIDSRLAYWKRNPEDTRMYELELIGLIEFPEFEEIFNHMLSSFKFIEANNP